MDKCLVCGKESEGGKFNGWHLCFDCYQNREEDVKAKDAEVEEERNART
jgi:hypothetical protein